MSAIHQFYEALQSWEWVAALLARVAVGFFFFLSGRGKLFQAERRESMRQTLEEAGIPAPGFNAVFVSSVEFGGGLLLMLGALTPVAAFLLICVMVVAVATVRGKTVEPDSPLAWLSEFLYLPEVLYVLILFWLFLAGGGPVSVDRWIFSAAATA